MSPKNGEDWKYIGKGKVITEDRQVNTVASRGEIYERDGEYKVNGANGERIFNKSHIRDIKLDSTKGVVG